MAALFSCFFSCSNKVLQGKKQVKSLFLKKIVVIYTLEEFSPYFPPAPKTQNQRSYCLKNTEIVFKNKYRYPFHDSYETNFYLKKFVGSDKRLQTFTKKNILSDSLLDILPIWNMPSREKNKFPERRIGDTSYKYELGNINGFLTISSSEIFESSDDKLKLFILFGVTGKFFLYKGFNEYVIENSKSNSSNSFCSVSEHLLYDDFLVVDKISKYFPLDEKVIKKLGLQKANIDTIKIPIYE